MQVVKGAIGPNANHLGNFQGHEIQLTSVWNPQDILTRLDEAEIAQEIQAIKDEALQVNYLGWKLQKEHLDQKGIFDG